MSSKYLNYGMNYLKVLKGLKTPLNLIHLVTNRCNMQCSHCFYWKELNQGSEMDLEQIETLVKSLKNKLNLLFIITPDLWFILTNFPANENKKKLSSALLYHNVPIGFL